jgi:hypothetical protein
MQVTRRNLAVAGVLALGASSLLHGTAVVAESSDEAAVNQAVDALRKALLEADKARLQQLAADQLSYGHSDGKVQTKPEFIDGVVTRKAVVKTLTFPELTVAVVGNAAIARHIYMSDSKPTASHQNQDRRPPCLAKAGRKLEAVGSTRLQAGLAIAGVAKAAPEGWHVGRPKGISRGSAAECKRRIWPRARRPARW